MATGKRPAKDVIVIDSSDDEPDRAGSSTAVLPAPSPHKRAKLSPRSSPKASPPPARSGLGGMDRAAMEQARLERQRAREAATASSSVQTTISPATAAVAQASSAWRANGAKVATLASVAAQEIESDETDDGEKTVAPVPSTSGPSTSPQNGNAAGVPRRFWEAEVRPTFNVYHPDTPNALKIEDVITQPDELLLAIVSSFCLDTPWVCGLFPPATPLVLVKHPNKDPAKSADRQIDPTGIFRFDKPEYGNAWLVHPETKKTQAGKDELRSSMHIKLFLLFYKDFCRVVIPTANAVDYDWSIIENMIWIQDFPRSSGITPAVSVPFVDTLESLLLTGFKMPAQWTKRLQDYDFSSAKARPVRLVPTLVGKHQGRAKVAQTGLFRLAREIRELGLQSGQGTGRVVSLECQGSSIGGYRSDWLKDVHRACSGLDPLPSQPALFNAPSATTDARSYVPVPRPSGSKPSTSGGDARWPPLKILFPSWQTVRGSFRGAEGGGTLFCGWDQWTNDQFPQHLFWDSRSKREGILQHTKMILGTFRDEAQLEGDMSRAEKIDDRAEGFLYVGSHNMTPAAWGRVGGTRSNPSLDCNNWELGVVMPVSKGTSDSIVGWDRPGLLPYGHDTLDRDARNRPRSAVPWMQRSYDLGQLN